MNLKTICNEKLMNFLNYRTFIDGDSVGIRKTGLFDQKLFIAALDDERTVILNIGHIKFPLLTPLQYVSGYDLKRCLILTGGMDVQKCLYLSISDDIYQQYEMEICNLLSNAINVDDCIFFDYSEQSFDNEHIYKEIIHSLGYSTERIRFNSEGSSSPDSAHISIHEVNIFQMESDSMKEKSGIRNIRKVFDRQIKACEESIHPQNGIVYLRASSLTQDLENMLWALYRNRFQLLGVRHPVSMEGSREEFISLIKYPGTIIPAIFREYTPVCFTFLMTHTGSCDWLKEGYLKSGREAGLPLLFCGGIVSATTGLSSYSIRLMQNITRLLSESGNDYTMTFETTDISENYIPKCLYKAVNLSGTSRCEMPSRLSKHIYTSYRIKN